MNKLLVVGNVVKDPRQNEAGSMLYFSVAITRAYKNKSTNEYESDFLSFMAFSSTADYIKKHVLKGDLVAIEAKVQNGKKKEGEEYPTDCYIVERINRLKKGKGHPENVESFSDESVSFFN